jgi:hypothetical protein
MKSYILEDISSAVLASIELRRILPGQENPWLLKAADGDAVAYLNIGLGDDGKPGYWITADISGRHHHEDAAVISILRQVQLAVGGTITDDDGRSV